MNIEEKAKAYDEALERARRIHEEILNSELIGFPEQIREIFPELREKPLTPFQQCLNLILKKAYFASVPGGIKDVDKFILDIVKVHTDELIQLAKNNELIEVQTESESEDERIRRCLCAIVKWLGFDSSFFIDNSVEKTRVLAWLEKQKDQNKCPEFCSGHCVGCERNEPKPAEKPKAKEYITPNEKFFQWIYDRLVYVHGENPDVDYMHSLKDRIEEMAEEQKPVMSNGISEQTKMNETVYKFTQEEWKKALDEQLPKEKKPVETSDFKTKLAEYMMKNRTGYSYNISSESILELAKEELIKRGELQKPVELSEEDFDAMFDEYCDQHPDGLTLEECGRFFYEKGEKACQEWSDEDEKIMQTMIKEGDLKPSEIAWLKSLRPVKQELSEKDRKILDDVSHILTGLNYKQVAQDYKQAVENLLSLRPQWKPTEEQMEALQRAIDACESEWAYQDDELRSLLNDLKKLM